MAFIGPEFNSIANLCPYGGFNLYPKKILPAHLEAKVGFDSKFILKISEKAFESIENFKQNSSLKNLACNEMLSIEKLQSSPKCKLFLNLYFSSAFLVGKKHRLSISNESEVFYHCLKIVKNNPNSYHLTLMTLVKTTINYNDKMLQDKITQENDLLRAMSNENGILRIKYWAKYSNKKDPTSYKIARIVDFLGSNLTTEISRQSLSIENKRAILIDIFSGIAAFHDRSFVVKSICPDSIWLTNYKDSKNIFLKAYLTDFKKICANKDVSFWEMKEDFLFYPPEILNLIFNQNDEVEKLLSSKADSWSAGLIAYQFFFMEEPSWFEDLMQLQILFQKVMISRKEQIYLTEEEYLESHLEGKLKKSDSLEKELRENLISLMSKITRFYNKMPTQNNYQFMVKTLLNPNPTDRIPIKNALEYLKNYSLFEFKYGS